MKKLLLILFLVSMTAHAEWKYDESSDIYDSYIDYSRIKTEGRYLSIWTLWDYKSLQTNSSVKQYKSSVIKRIVDCQGTRYQTVAIYEYSEQMGQGAAVFSTSPSFSEANWNSPPPNSFNEGYIKIACATNNNPKPPLSNPQNIKRQRCISLGLELMLI